jgi:hypothetical protein
VAREVEVEIGGRVVSDEEIAQKKEEVRESKLQASSGSLETQRGAKF